MMNLSATFTIQLSSIEALINLELWSTGDNYDTVSTLKLFLPNQVHIFQAFVLNAMMFADSFSKISKLHVRHYVTQTMQIAVYHLSALAMVNRKDFTQLHYKRTKTIVSCASTPRKWFRSRKSVTCGFHK